MRNGADLSGWAITGRYGTVQASRARVREASGSAPAVIEIRTLLTLLPTYYNESSVA